MLNPKAGALFCSMPLSKPMYDSHNHTSLCKHAVGEPGEYAAAGVDRGLRGIIFTCHNPLPGELSAGVRMTAAQFPLYLDLVGEARARWAGRLDVRLGLECDFLPDFGLEPWLKRQVAAASFDYLLVSIHPHLSEYRQRFGSSDAVPFQRTYFDHLALSAELKLHDALAHPDLVKIVTAASWQPARIIDHVRGCLDRIARTGLAMELNTSGWYKAVAEPNPGPPILREMALRGIPVVLGSDAHVPHRVGDRFLDALNLLEIAGYRDISFFLRRERHDLSIASARVQLLAAAGSQV